MTLDSPVPYWRAQTPDVVDPYREGLDLLGDALEFSFERLQASGIESGDLVGAGGRAILPLLAARAIGTVDAIHAVLTVGRVEQADILVRTLIDLQADAHLLAAGDDAFGFYSDWAIVEQARSALQMRPEEITGPSRSLEDRRNELAADLVERLGREDKDTAAALAGVALDGVLSAFCKSRYGSRWPSSWRQGYMLKLNLSTDQLRQVIIARAIEAIETAQVPDDVRELFVRSFERELELLFGYLSGEVHNSPLAINRLIDQSNWTLRVHGDIDGLPRPLTAAFQHLLRMMLLFEDVWSSAPAIAEWSDRATAVGTWMEKVN